MKRTAFLVALISLLLFSSTTVWADETGKEGHHSEVEQVQTNTQHDEAPESHNMTADEHSNMNDEQHDPTSNSHSTNSHGNTTDSHTDSTSTHEEPESSGGHGHGDVVETPANIPVLAIFGAINLAFLLYGVWNKWLRTKGGTAA